MGDDQRLAFEEALGKVFGERCDGFSTELKDLLRQLYSHGRRDGWREGHEREHHLQDYIRRLDARQHNVQGVGLIRSSR